MISKESISSIEALMRSRQGPVTLADSFDEIGVLQCIQKVSADGNNIEISSTLQKNYDVIETQSVTLNRDFACDMAHAILRHFGEVE